MLFQVSIVHSFLLLLVFHCLTYYNLSINLLMNIRVMPTLKTLKIKLLGTFEYTSLYGHMLSFLLGRYVGVEWLGHTVGRCLSFKKWSMFSNVAVPFYFPSSRGWVSLASCPHQRLVGSVFLISPTLKTGCSGTSLWLCICLETNDVDIFSCSYLPALYLLWWSARTCL